jgi:leucyl-tRNA synthetase
MYIGGEEHAVLHLLYSRFTTMVLNELGHLEFEEPYKRFRKHGLLIRDGAKMSKSRGNVVIPDEYIEQYGADTFRAYLMFLGPYQEGGDFRDRGIVGIERFLNRVWEAVLQSIGEGRSGVEAGDIERRLNVTIKQVTEDIEALSYNTALAALMEYLNALRYEGRVPSLDEVRPLVLMVAPFAPHLSEELWERLGSDQSVFEGVLWPEYDPQKLRAEVVEMPVQVNGRLRATIVVDRGASTETVQALALADENVQRHVSDATIRKVVHVPDRLLNLVVQG